MQRFPLLFDLRFPALKQNLPVFNEFRDRYDALTPENKAAYARDRMALLRAWHGGKPIKGVETTPFAYQSGDYAGAGTVYRPAGREDTLPALLFIHGGGWTTLCADCYAYECAALALEAEASVIAVDYRMAPEFPFPAAAEDCFSAFAALLDQAGKLNIDPARVAVAGDSAGGNLAAALCVMARDRLETLPCAQLLCYPAGDLRAGGARRAGYLESARDETNIYASPMLTDLSNLPPALIIVGTCDFLFDDNRRFARALRRAGTRVDMIVYEGLPHGFIQMQNEYGRDALSAMAGALREAFYGEAPRLSREGLVDYRFRRPLEGLPAFNEFSDHYREMTKENLSAYQAERWALLRAWHRQEAITGVKIKPFSCRNGDYTVRGDVYIPENASAPLPMVLYAHGGGMTLRREQYAYECAQFAREGGCAVFSVDYHTRTRCAYPDAVEDVYAALEAAVQRAGEYGADGARVALAGDSFGGNICASVAKMARDRRGPKIRLQILLYPRTLLSMGMIGLAQDYEPAIMSNPLATPYLGDLTRLPETMIIVGSMDFLLDDNLHFARKLMESGVKVDLKIYQGLPHGFIQMQNEAGADARKAVCEKLRSALSA